MRHINTLNEHINFGNRWYEEDQDPSAEAEFPSRDLLFECIGTDDSNVAILSKKSDRTMWLLDTVHLMDEASFTNYIPFVKVRNKRVEKGYDVEYVDPPYWEQYAIYATIEWKKGRFIEDCKDLDDLNNSEESRLYKMNPLLAKYTLDILTESLYEPGFDSEQKEAISFGIRVLLSEFPEMEDDI